MNSKPMLCAVLVILELLLFCGCVSTTLVYSPNVYQTGRILGGETVKIRGSIEGAPRIVTGPDGTTLQTHADANQQNLLLSLGLHRSLIGHTDFGVEAGISPSLSARAYIKTQLTPESERFAASLMPALIYGAGSRDVDDNTGETIRSYAYGAELHVPMSYSLQPHFDLTWAPKLVYLHYTAPYRNSAPQEEDLPFSQTRNRDLTCGGFAMGFKWGFFHPEISVLFLFNPASNDGNHLDNPLYAFGMGFHK